MASTPSTVQLSLPSTRSAQPSSPARAVSKVGPGVQQSSNSPAHGVDVVQHREAELLLARKLEYTAPLEEVGLLGDLLQRGGLVALAQEQRPAALSSAARCAPCSAPWSAGARSPPLLEIPNGIAVPSESQHTSSSAQRAGQAERGGSDRRGDRAVSSRFAQPVMEMAASAGRPRPAPGRPRRRYPPSTLVFLGHPTLPGRRPAPVQHPGTTVLACAGPAPPPVRAPAPAGGRTRASPCPLRCSVGIRPPIRDGISARTWRRVCAGRQPRARIRAGAGVQHRPGDCLGAWPRTGQPGKGAAASAAPLPRRQLAGCGTSVAHPDRLRWARRRAGQLAPRRRGCGRPPRLPG